MSDSSLSDLPDMDFISTPMRATKHSLSSSSPASERPSKKIKLVYRKPSQPTSSPNYKAPHRLSTSPLQSTSNPEPTLVSKLELQHLRENNGFLRRSNIELAKTHSQAKAQVGALQEQVKTVKEETSEARLLVERLKRENQLLGTMTKEGFNPAAAAQRMTKLEEIRKIYWECGVEWARKEKAWGMEKELFKKEVTDLVRKVEGLEGELAEERAKIRRFEGEELERERERSMRRGMVGGGQYGQQMLENGISVPGSDAMHGLGMMMTSENDGTHVEAPSWHLQQSALREQKMRMQRNAPQQWQDVRMMHQGQEQGFDMMSGALALQDLGRGHAQLHGQEQQRMLTMQEQFEAQQQEHGSKNPISPGQFDGLGHDAESFSDMLTGSEIIAGAHNGLSYNGNGFVNGQQWELQAMMGTQSEQLKFEDDDMEDWETPDDGDGTYDPEQE